MGPRDDSLDELREQVAAAARELAADGLVQGTSGNVSARTADLVAITPTGARLAGLRGEQVTVVDRRGAVVDGDLAPSSELGLHLAIYERHGGAAVVHTHAPMATALACSVDELPCVHYSMLALGGAVPVAPYHTFGTPELAAATAQALDGHLAALMAGHGAITYGTDLDHAVENTRLLEWAATVYWHAAAIATPRTMDAAQRQAVVEAVTARGYGTTRRHDA